MTRKGLAALIVSVMFALAVIGVLLVLLVVGRSTVERQIHACTARGGVYDVQVQHCSGGE